MATIVSILSKKGDRMSDSNEEGRFTPIPDLLEESAREYQRENRKIRRQRAEEYLDQSFDYRDYVVSPEGYEGAVLVFYVSTVPYVAGLLFIYLFISRAQAEYFIGLDLASFFVIWAIGYEVCAAAVLGAIFYGWLKYLAGRTDKEPKRNKPLF